MRIPFTSYEIRATSRQPRPDPWDDFWFGSHQYQTLSGADVNEDSALRHFAVWACVKVISEDLASIPLHVIRQEGKFKERATDHPVYMLLHDAPNPEMTAMQLREALQAHVLLWGNGYCEIQRNLRGIPMALWPLSPARMLVKRGENNELIYEYTNADGTKRLFQKEEILHIAGLGFNGLTGYSVIGYQREAIAQGLVQQDFQNGTLKNGARLSLAITHPAPKAPNPENRKVFREELNKEYGGRANAGKIMTLWEGMKAEKLSMSNEDAQFLDTWKLNRSQICAIFRVPPHKIMDLERATFSNIENQDIGYVKDTIRPWAVRWEQDINQRLLANSKEFYVKHLLDGLMRGDILSRYQAYAIGRQWGWFSVNDIREFEDMNPVKGGDERLQPLNMSNLGEAPEGGEDAPITDAEKEQAARALRQLKLIRRG